jgi:hypothetical protein
MALTREDKQWLFNLAKQVVSIVDGSYAVGCFNAHESEFLDDGDKNYCPDCSAFLPNETHKPMCRKK